MPTQGLTGGGSGSSSSYPAASRLMSSPGLSREDGKHFLTLLCEEDIEIGEENKFTSMFN